MEEGDRHAVVAPAVAEAEVTDRRVRPHEDVVAHRHTVLDDGTRADGDPVAQGGQPDDGAGADGDFRTDGRLRRDGGAGVHTDATLLREQRAQHSREGRSRVIGDDEVGPGFDGGQADLGIDEHDVRLRGREGVSGPVPGPGAERDAPRCSRQERRRGGDLVGCLPLADGGDPLTEHFSDVSCGSLPAHALLPPRGPAGGPLFFLGDR